MKDELRTHDRREGSDRRLLDRRVVDNGHDPERRRRDRRMGGDRRARDRRA